MPILDFNEIPSARADKSPPGLEDTFELFSRDFFEMMGYGIISPPNRGPDFSKDIVVEEVRRGIGGETKIKWLVSCKHYAYSGESISPKVELNISDRVRANNCNGFIGFYSTIPSSGLIEIIEGLTDIEHQIFDKERIEKYVLGSSEGIEIGKRYFHQSIRKWLSSRSRPADILLGSQDLLCVFSGQSLLIPEPRGIIALGFYKDHDGPRHYEDIYWCLKGEPDRILEREFLQKGLLTEWEDISDIIIPTVFIRWCISPLNQLRSGVTFSDEAFEKYKSFIIAIFPYIARDLSEEEKERVFDLRGFPTYLGGLGY